MRPSDFVRRYSSYARLMEKETGLSAVAILSQAALESAWGKSAPGNMFFGVKAKNSTPDSKKQLLKTTEYLRTPNKSFPVVLSVKPYKKGVWKYRVKDWFMKYDTPYESFIDHARLFKRLSRYDKAWRVRSDYEQFFIEIHKAGYATAPNYASILSSVARKIKAYY